MRDALGRQKNVVAVDHPNGDACVSRERRVHGSLPEDFAIDAVHVGWKACADGIGGVDVFDVHVALGTNKLKRGSPPFLFGQTTTSVTVLDLIT